MTSWFYGMKRGQNHLASNMHVATSTDSTQDFELRVNALDANSVAVQKQDVMKFLCMLERYILSSGKDGADPSTSAGGTDLPPL